MLSQQRALRLKLPYPETHEVLGWEVSKGPLGAAVVGKPEAAVVEREKTTVVAGADWVEAVTKSEEAAAWGTGVVLVELLAMGVVEDASARLPPLAAQSLSCRCTRR